jgi:hypothetical protein
MSSQKVNNANAKKNNGGIVVQAGNTSGTLVSDLAVKSINGSKNQYGTKVVTDTAVAPFDYTDPHGVIKAKSAGTFAYTPAAGTNYIVRAAGDNASKINNSSSALLNVPGGVTNRSINRLTKTTQVGTYATHKFDMLAVPSSGNFPGLTRGTGAGTPVLYVQADDGTTTSNVDDASRPSRSVPGELTYHFGGINKPTSTGYKARDSYES